MGMRDENEYFTLEYNKQNIAETEVELPICILVIVS